MAVGIPALSDSDKKKKGKLYYRKTKNRRKSPCIALATYAIIGTADQSDSPNGQGGITMYEMLIINDGKALVRDGDKWMRAGQEVDARHLIRTLAALMPVVEVQAVRTDGVIDVYEYVDGRYYRTTYAVNA